MFRFALLITLAAVCAAHTCAEDSGADPFKLQSELCTAISAGDPKAVAAALDKGAQLDRDCPEQMTPPLHHAVDTGKTEVVALLLDRGADVNQKDNGVSATPIHYAAAKHDPALVKLLAKRGANVNALTDEGLSPLAFVIMDSDDAATAQALLDAGADVSAVDEQGDTLLDTALAKGYKKVAALLESKGGKRGEDPGALSKAPMPTNAPQAQAPQQAPPGTAKRTAEGQLIFKGFYIGMPIEEAARKMLDLGFHPGGTGTSGVPQSMLEADGLAPYKYGGPWRGKEPLEFTKNALNETVLTGQSWIMGVDAERRVSSFVLYGALTNEFFGSGDLSGFEFAQAFTEAYGIPGMEVSPHGTSDFELRLVSNSLLGWLYVDREHGWGVRIDEQKNLVIVRLATRKALKFD